MNEFDAIFTPKMSKADQLSLFGSSRADTPKPVSLLRRLHDADQKALDAKAEAYSAKVARQNARAQKTLQKVSTKAPKGFMPIPDSKHGGFHKRVGNAWHTWYPTYGTGPHPNEQFSDDEHYAQHGKHVAAVIREAQKPKPVATDGRDRLDSEWAISQREAQIQKQDQAIANIPPAPLADGPIANHAKWLNETARVKGGEQFTTPSGRVTNPVPKLGVSSHANSKKLAQWAITEAKNEAANNGAEHHYLLLSRMNPGHMTQGDMDTVNEIAFGSERAVTNGMRVEGKVKPQPLSDYAQSKLAEWEAAAKWRDSVNQKIRKGGMSEFDDIFGVPMQKAMEKPPKGYTAIPQSKHGGFHKRVGNTYKTWYPDGSGSGQGRREERRSDRAVGKKPKSSEARRTPAVENRNQRQNVDLDGRGRAVPAQKEPRPSVKPKPVLGSGGKPSVGNKQSVLKTGKSGGGKGRFYDVNPKVSTTDDGVADGARVGIPARVGVVKEIPRLPRLTPDERAIENKFAKMAEQNMKGMADNFYERAKKENYVFETDGVKSLLPDWDRPDLPKEARGEPINPERAKVRALYNTALHQTANAIAKVAFTKRLDEIANLPESQRKILVTCGGVSAGKGSALGARPDLAASAAATWDAAGEQNATENPWLLEECEKRGIKMSVLFVHADPKEAWPGVVERAKGIGRMVDARLFADSYGEGAKNANAFYEKNKDNPHVEFVFAKFAGRDPEAVGNAITKAKDKASADGNADVVAKLDKALEQLKAEPHNAGAISMANNIKVPATPSEGMPPEALAVDSDEVYHWASGHIDSVRESIPDYIYKGATAGRRIWKTK